MPEISVIMAAYNAVPHVGKAIDSILAQTYSDFEFIIINDGSKDETLSILQDYAARDKRIRIISHENMGLTKSLNLALASANGKFIARQDADDISYPERFERQLVLIQNDPDIVLVGGCSDDAYDDGSRGSWPYHDDNVIQKIVYLKTPFPHSTALFRADTARALGGYDETFRTAQDMDLWMRMAKRGKLAMVGEPVLLRTVGGGSISVKRRWRQFYDALRARLKHNDNPVIALYHSLRSIIIALLPPTLIRQFKGTR